MYYRREEVSGKARERNHDFFEDFMDDEFEKGNGSKNFSYEVLARATNNFDEGEKLGGGGFGGVYKGFLRDENVFIAVRRFPVDLNRGSRSTHMRFKIGQGLASALLYLHEEWEQCVVHRDVKSSNVMLDSSFIAKLGDFGLARLVDHEKGAQKTMLAGTMGYLAPECFITGRASKESDVYSFGIVALDIASGKRPTMLAAADDLNRIRTVEWAWEKYGRGDLIEAADLKLNSEFDEEEMRRLLVVALWCAHPDFNFEAELPVLPPTMPIPTYLAPPAALSSSEVISTIDQMKYSGYTSNSDSSNFTSSPASLLHSR